MTATRAAATVGLAAAIAVALTGCSWRLETPEPTWPSPDAVTVTRDAAAEREQAVIDALSRSDGTASDEVLAAYEGEAAPERLAALGGVYVAYPDATPSPSASPTTSAADAVETARDGAIAAALETSDDDLAFMLTSTALSHGLMGWYAWWAETTFTDPETDVVELRLFSSAPTDTTDAVPVATALDVDTLATLVEEHDRTRYLYEVLAAKASDEEREQWLARRDLQDARAEALAALPGVEDRRAPIYVVSNEGLEDADGRVSAAQAAETALGDRYAALLDGLDDAEKPWVLSAAFDAYAQAAAYAEPGTHDAVIPALPGITAES
ncbi:hypothetical protein [Demequina sp. NBRC 110055]|uniref:hypothetical protein n=1 Tax=Demequina sp. NBRC 110055 TaxID=1570344 RepID=UPI000A00AB96|nr:hypothetical protein [Demequina sp. NBRC 110055]